MENLIILLKTLPFALWGLFLFLYLPEKKEIECLCYATLTMLLAFLLFNGGRPAWQIDKSPESFFQQAKTSRAMIPNTFTNIALGLGFYLPADEEIARTLISLAIIMASLVIFVLTIQLSNLLSGLFAQYLFLLSFNYHNKDNLYTPLPLALVLAYVAIYFFFLARQKNHSPYLLILSGLLSGIAGAFFPLTLIYSLSALVIIYREKKNISFATLLLTLIISLILTLSIGKILYPAYSPKILFTLNLKGAWKDSQQFIWFNSLLVGIFASELIRRSAKSDYLWHYSVWGLIFLSGGSLFLTNNYNQLLLALPLIVVPLAIWWMEVYPKKITLIFLSVLIITNLTMGYIDLF